MWLHPTTILRWAFLIFCCFCVYTQLIPANEEIHPWGDNKIKAE